ncbi:MAG TPA: SAM-dependent methyltransferase [Gammaproteobacteria bacterium]|nr:SAM-dependent methyltransferase [Gammaproteobacteria bacterium]
MTMNAAATTRLPRLSIALVSAAALGYEVLLMRLFSIIQWHHFAYMIISLALLGYGASGTFVSLARPWLMRHYGLAYCANLTLFGLSSVLCFLLAQGLPFNPEELLWDWRQPLYLTQLYLLLAAPFFFAANAIALALSRYRTAIARLYAADLLGAGLGSLLVVGLLFVCFPQTALQAIGAIGLLASLVATRELRLNRRWLFAIMAGMAGLLLLPSSLLQLQVSPYKSLPQTLRISGTQVIAQHTSPLGLLSVVASDRVPLRHAPGLSLYADAPIPRQLGVFTDAGGMTAIDHNPSRARLDYLDQLGSALPYYLATPQRVLILGAGGGSGIRQALNHDVPHIDAVELNPQMAALLQRDFADWSGQLYGQDAVRLHLADARGFVKRSRDNFDLIQISLLDAWGASGSGLYSLNENYLYTVEALQDYLKRLAPGGYLSVSRWIRLPPRDTLKLFATAVRALESLGTDNPAARLVWIRSWQTSTLLIKQGAFTAEELDALHRFCSARAFDLVWYPGMQETEANRINRLDGPDFHAAAVALAGPDAADFMARYKFDIRPATDDRPYFFHFFKWRVLPEILSLRGAGGLPLLEAGYLVLAATLLQALLLSMLLILLPLAVLRQRTTKAGVDTGSWRMAGYFFSIGLAFLFIEIAFIQKFILFLHHPLYAAATVLAAFLVFAGLGSAWAARLPQETAARAILICAWLIALLGSAYTLLPSLLFEQLIHLGMAARIAVSVLLIAPLAFCMGMPFPLGLSRVAAQAPAFVPWAWGINGCASVLSAVTATLLAIHFGFSVVVLLALLLYLLAARLFP